MNKEEIEAAQRFIGTPITAENLEPAVGVYPVAEPSEALVAAKRKGLEEAYLDCANYMQATQSTPDWAYLEFKKRAELAKKEH